MTQTSEPEFHGRPTRSRPKIQVAALVSVIVVLVATVTFATHPWSAGPAVPSPSPIGGVPASGSVPASGGVPASPAASTSTDWTAVQPVAIPAVATIEADQGDAAGIQPGSTFSLASLTDEPATALAGRLEVSPQAELAVTAGSDASHAILAPRAPLVPGTVYRLSLRAPDGTTEGSWAYRVRSPVHVLTTIPGDKATAVPTATGVEVTFDQDGVADMGDHFSITPAVAGRFERHGRTQVFVPDRLADSTLYTVTIRAGLGREGTDLSLGSDVVFRFETAGTASEQARILFGRAVAEVGPTAPAVLGVQIIAHGQDPETAEASVTSADVKVYRLPDVEAATQALEAFVAAPRWTSFTDPLMPTDGLPVVATFTAPLERLAEPAALSAVIRFPEALGTGFYVVEIAGARRSQAFLQVTPVAAWVSVLSDRTVTWVNDVTTRHPISGASVGITGGQALGTTDDQGLSVAPTPAALIPEAEAGGTPPPSRPPMLTVKAPGGDLLLVPFGIGSNGEIYRGEWWEKTTAADSAFWSLLQSDRSVYRTSDTIDVWGYLRDRDDGAVPAQVGLRIVDSDSTGTTDPPAVAAVTVTPRASGAYLASIPLSHVPLGTYVIQSVVGGRVVASHWVQVDVIRKPAYEVALEPNHTAVITGTDVRWTATATFFDGSAAPSLALSFADDQAKASTDGDGHASVTLAAPAPDASDEQGVARWDIGVRPAGPEQTDISADAIVLVFPSAVHLAASATVGADGRLRLTGTLHQVDLPKIEAKIAAGTWDEDPDGAAMTGATVRAAITELVSVRRQVGTDYDFIEMVVRPRYEYDTVRKPVRTLTLTTDGRGALAASVAVPDSSHQYEVALSTTDAKNRYERLTVYGGRPSTETVMDTGTRFETSDGKPAGDHPYAIGDRVVWTMQREGATLPSGSGDRYLYIVAQRGLKGVAVTDTPTYRHTYKAEDAPGIFIVGVEFTGSTYAPKAAAWADFDAAGRKVSVSVTADHDRYRPGEDAILTVRTLDAAGDPVAASVTIDVVDQKLYAIGAAQVSDPLGSLYHRVDSGIVRLTASHQVPTNAGPEGEGGDTTGGDGGRSDFRDRLAFETVTTGADGRAHTTVHLSDDLTSWHVTASAVTAGLGAGVGERIIPVGLPLFVEATVADEYLVTDHPIIRLRAFGEALRAGDPVRFTVRSSSLDMPATTVSGKAFDPVSVTLPALTEGPQSLDISVVAPTRTDADGPLTDRLIRTFGVVGSRLTAARSAYATAGGTLPVIGGSDAATYTFSDAGRGRFIPLLADLAATDGARADQALAQAVARDLLIEGFGRDPVSLAPAAFEIDRYEIVVEPPEDSATAVGMPLLPYGGPDPWLTVRVALIAPDRVDARALKDALVTIRDQAATARDLRIASLAGLAALGEPVLDALDEASKASDLSPLERLYLGLGYQAQGDEKAALAIEQSVARSYGRQLGGWIRLTVGETEVDRLEATSLFMLLAAGLGDPLAAGAAQYLIDEPSNEATHVLDLVGYVGRALERTPSAAASFAYTVAGDRKVVSLRPGESLTVRLTPQQRTGLAVERLSGQVGIAVSWRDAVDAAAIVADPTLVLTRSVPKSPVPADRLVTVGLRASFKPEAPTSGCYEVVETVPSGLVPIDRLGDTTAVGPSSVVGQRVTFCAPYDPKQGSTVNLQYKARVVNEGTFSWEPATMQLPGAPDAIAVTGSTTVRIGGG